MYEGVSKCVKRPLSDNTSNNMTNSRANIVETNMWPQHSRAGDWVGYPTYYCKTQSLGKSFIMHDPNLWAQLNYASTQTQWGWVH